MGAIKHRRHQTLHDKAERPPTCQMLCCSDHSAALPRVTREAFAHLLHARGPLVEADLEAHVWGALQDVLQLPPLLLFRRWLPAMYCSVVLVAVASTQICGGWRMQGSGRAGQAFTPPCNMRCGIGGQCMQRTAP